MTEHLSPIAARLYLETTRASYFWSLASWTETEARLQSLRLLCERGNASETEASRILSLNETHDEFAWYDDSENENRIVHEQHGLSEIIRVPVESWNDDEHDFMLKLYPSPNTGLAEWEFHQTDPDYFPSIPHGHWHGRKRPKLDPYLGWVYDGTTQTKREPRWKIIALWNDSNFRKFASATIDYYLFAFPSYSGWRVPNPRTLPKFRRRNS